MSMKIELGISLNKPTNNSESVVKKPSWSKVLPSNILKYSVENVNWDYTSEDMSSEMMWNELREKLDGLTMKRSLLIILRQIVKVFTVIYVIRDS